MIVATIIRITERTTVTTASSSESIIFLKHRHWPSGWLPKTQHKFFYKKSELSFFAHLELDFSSKCVYHWFQLTFQMEKLDFRRQSFQYQLDLPDPSCKMG